VTEEEADILHSVASGKTKSDRVVALRNWRKGRAACPACHLILPWMQQGQLRSTRVATCDNLRCKRVIIDISF
jgi:hypothetical protein